MIFNLVVLIFFPCEFGLASIKTAINSFSRNIKTTIIEMQLG